MIDPVATTLIAGAGFERGRSPGAASGEIAWWMTGAVPELVLLHGFADDADCWAPVMPILSGLSMLSGLGGVLAVDARGHGASALPVGAVGPAPQAADVAVVLATLQARASTAPVRSVVLIGHSMGAVTAAVLAAERPDLVMALVLEDPPPDAYADTSPRGVPGWLGAARALPQADRIAACRRENPRWPEDEPAFWATAKERVDLDYCQRPTVVAPPLSCILSAVTCPVLLLYGSRQRGGMLERQNVENLRSVCGPRLSAVQIAEAGHNVRRDARGSFAAALQTWIPSAVRITTRSPPRTG